MKDKNIVAMEQFKCPICGDTHSHNAGIILSKRLNRNIPNSITTGYGLCEPHDKLDKDGYIALVGADPDKSEFESNGNCKISGAYRTGQLVHVRREVLSEIITISEEDKARPFIFCDPGVVEYLINIQERSDEASKIADGEKDGE